MNVLSSEYATFWMYFESYKTIETDFKKQCLLKISHKKNVSASISRVLQNFKWVLLNCASTSTQFHSPPPSSTQLHPLSSFEPPPSSIYLHPAHFSLHPALCNILNNIRTKMWHVILSPWLWFILCLEITQRGRSILLTWENETSCAAIFICFLSLLFW